MIVTVKDFVPQWNKTHTRVNFSSYKASGSSRPVSVEVRFPELYGVDLDAKDWNQMNALVEEESQGTVIVTTNAQSYVRGVIQLLIASRSSNFDERRVVWTLEKLGDFLEE